MIKRKNPPYHNTAVAPEKTQGQITELLKEYGASGVQWTTLFEKGTSELKFALDIELEGVKKMIYVKVTPPQILGQHVHYDPRTGRNIKINAPNQAQSFRLLFYWLKSKLEAIAYGVVSAEEEFLSHVVISLPNGAESTVLDAIIHNVAEGRLSLPEEKQERKVIEVENH